MRRWPAGAPGAPISIASNVTRSARGMTEGWKSVNRLVLNESGKPVDAESFAKSLPSLDAPSLTKTSRAYLNVQCENCHGIGADHPMGPLAHHEGRLDFDLPALSHE